MIKTDKLAIQIAVKHGFTFSGDSFFSSYRQARMSLNRLVRNGYLEIKIDEKDGKQEYLPTSKARDFIEYGIEN